jgi:hypothetical protein
MSADIIVLSSDDEDDEESDNEVRRRQELRRSVPHVPAQDASLATESPSPSPASNKMIGQSAAAAVATKTESSSTRRHKTEDKSEVRAASPSRMPIRRVPDDWDEHKLRPYQCHFCNGKFLSTNLFEKHTLLHEELTQAPGPPVPQYECVVCNRRFLYPDSRSSHMLLKHGDRFIPPGVQPGDNVITKRKETQSIPEPPEKKLKTEKSAKKIKKSVNHNEVRKNVAAERSEHRPVIKSQTESSKSMTGTVISRTPAPKVNRRPARLNVDFTRDQQTERECSMCRTLFRDPLTHQFHSPCFDETPFRQSGGYKCPSCPTSTALYASLFELREHSARHRVPPFSCSYCQTRTQLLYEMELHVVQKHSDKLS